MFIKHGDGKILSVVLNEEEELTAEQKKAAKDLSKQVIKKSDDADASEVMKQSGR